MRTSAPEGWGISWRGGRACACRARSTVWRALGRTTFRRPIRPYSRAPSSGGPGVPTRRSCSSCRPVPDTMAPAFDGKVSLVAGASRGIGAATARAFAQAGAAVVLAARDAHALDAVAAEIRAAGGRALAVPTDVGDAAAVEHLV